MTNNNTIEEIFFRRVKSITSESHYEDERTREIFHNGFNEALGMVQIELFGTPKTKGFLKEQIELAEQSLVMRLREELAQRIGMTRQWLNEDRIDDVKKMVDNKDLEVFLSLPSLLTTPDEDNQ